MIDNFFNKSYVKEGYCKQNQENAVYLWMDSPNALGSEITPPCLTLEVNTFRSTEPLLLLLQLSYFSRAQLCVTPYMAGHEVPPSMEFSRQEHWLLLLLSCFSHVQLRPGSPPGSPVPGILQARTLEWVAISFSNAWKWKWKWSRSVMSNS